MVFKKSLSKLKQPEAGLFGKAKGYMFLHYPADCRIPAEPQTDDLCQWERDWSLQPIIFEHANINSPRYIRNSIVESNARWRYTTQIWGE